MDYTIAAATVLASVGTLAAVLVALFAQDWRQRRTRPALRLVAGEDRGPVTTYYPVFDSEGTQTGDDPWAEGALEIAITNPAGRETAKDVTVLATVTDEEMGWRRTVQEPLTWESGLLGLPGTDQKSIPAGVSMSIPVVYLGEGSAILSRHHEIHPPGDDDLAWADGPSASVAVYPARKDTIKWLRRNIDYALELIVAGSNFDAQTYRGRFKVTQDRGSSTPYIDLRAEWLEEPTNVPPGAKG